MNFLGFNLFFQKLTFQYFKNQLKFYHLFLLLPSLFY
jgi:hypothetical protein